MAPGKQDLWVPLQLFGTSSSIVVGHVGDVDHYQRERGPQRQHVSLWGSWEGPVGVLCVLGSRGRKALGRVDVGSGRH